MEIVLYFSNPHNALKDFNPLPNKGLSFQILIAAKKWAPHPVSIRGKGGFGSTGK